MPRERVLAYGHMHSPSLLDLPERAGSWGRFLPHVLLAAITFALYSSSLYFYFVWDDFPYVVNNYRIQQLNWESLRAIWTTTYLSHYAPVHHTVYVLTHAVFGLNPFGYHLVQLLLHVACVLLAYELICRLERPAVAFLAGLLFAVHPTNVETVAWISESKSTLAFFFFLISFRYFIRLRERGRWMDGLLAGLFHALSMLAKINTVVAPVIFLLYDYRSGASLKNLKWKSLLAYFSLSGIMTLVHLGAFHGGAQQIEREYMGGAGTHVLNLPLLLSFYLQMIVFPHPLSAWQMFPVEEGVTALVVLGWLGLAAMSLFLFRAGRRIQFWGLWIFVFLLPVLQIIPFNIWVADRYLYIPGIGGFVLLSELLLWLRGRLRERAAQWGLEAAFASALLLMGWQTYRHVPIWTNDLTLWAATTPTCMTSAYCHTNLGLALLQSGQTEQGIEELRRAVEIHPHPGYLELLGDAYTMAAGNYPEALRAYQEALNRSGQEPGKAIFGKVARAHLLAGNLPQAAQAIEAGKKFNPQDPGLWIAAGIWEWKSGNTAAAREAIQKALLLSGGTPNPAGYLTEFWGKPAEVGQFLAELSLRKN
ncbi:MAG TPA: glycosyltransferase family 39 protein [Terriglobia bacterium]|nr:glycosyltransferase family 39 protein [Terriglobia bacterium]